MSDKTIDFYYLKGKNYSSFHIDGAYGGLSPKGLIRINFFSESYPLPYHETYQFIENEDGHNVLGNRINEKTKIKEGIIRNVECEAIMNIQTAKRIKEWLERQIAEFEKQVSK